MGFNNSNDMARANSIINSLDESNVRVKRIKRDNGLIERTNKDDEKIILAEDNRQVLFG
jgi:hypothetical protein